MKIVAIVLVSTLLGLMAWLVYDSHAKADGMRNEMELLRRQVYGALPAAGDTAGQPPALPPGVSAADVQAGHEEQQRRSRAGTPLPPGTPLMAEPTPPPAATAVPGAPPAPAPAPGYTAPAPGYPAPTAPPAYAGAPGQPAPPAYAPTAPAPGGYPAGAPAGSIQPPTLDPTLVAPVSLTPRQKKIAGLPSIAKVKFNDPNAGFVILDGGESRKLSTGMRLAVRRGTFLVARIELTSVEPQESAADVAVLYPGASIEVGDEVIQDVPPEG